MFINVILIILGFALLIKGADFLVDGASNIAKKFNIPEIVIGLTIVSIGTSMPELMVSITSAIGGHSDMAMGNIVGSNIANLFLILGTCAVIKSLEFKRETRLIESPFMICVTILLFVMGNYGGKDLFITRIEGIILLILCLVFIIYNIIMAKKGGEFDKEDITITLDVDKKSISIWKSILSVILGIVALKFGGDFVVNSSSKIASMIGISEKLISLTIVAFSTSLPELITSITASLKGETDMAIGNIIGSQTFNILLIIGISATFSPIKYDISYNSDMILLIIGTIFLGLFPFFGKKNYMTRISGVAFVVTYVLYMVELVLTNINV